MQNISDLIKEAKPLYFARKKRNKKIKIGFGIFSCFILMFFVMPKKDIVDASWYWDLNETMNEETYVENYGFPVDDYGLLLVV